MRLIWRDGAMVLERLEEKLLGDQDCDYIPRGDMPPPFTNSIPDASYFPLSS
jgi:hypothetical protein